MTGRETFHSPDPGMKDSNTSEIQIRPDDLSGPEIAGMLQKHLDFMATQSPPESIHALDLEALKGEAISFWSASNEQGLVGCVALKTLSADHGEIKSMHTAQHARGRGVAGLLLRHVLAEAGRRGYRRLSLETGTSDGFQAAQALYRRHGFEVCPPFADYVEDPHSLCMTKLL